MRSIKPILTLMLMTASLAEAETLYVRPTTTCANNGDGSAYVCAASPGGAGAWRGLASIVFTTIDETAGQLDPGDTLKVCGSFGVADKQATNALIQASGSGTADKRVTWDGDCSADGDLGAAILDGQDSLLYGINTSSYAYHTFKHFIVQRQTSRALLGYAHSVNDVTLDKFVVFESITCLDILSASGDCWDLRGRDFTIRNSSCARVGRDCVQSNGKRLLVEGSRFVDFSLLNANAGDGIQNGGEVDGTIYRRNYIRQDEVDSKYCGIASGVTDAGFVLFEDNECIRNPAFATAAGFYTETAAVMRRNRVIGGRFGLHCAVQIGVQCDVTDNIIHSQSEAGIAAGNLTTTSTIKNNIVVGAPQCVQTNTSSSTVVIAGNRFALCPIGIKEVNTSATHTEHHNTFHGIAIPIDRGGAFSVGNGSVVEGTGQLTRAAAGNE